MCKQKITERCVNISKIKNNYLFPPLPCNCSLSNNDAKGEPYSEVISALRSFFYCSHTPSMLRIKKLASIVPLAIRLSGCGEGIMLFGWWGRGMTTKKSCPNHCGWATFLLYAIVNFRSVGERISIRTTIASSGSRSSISSGHSTRQRLPE